MIEEQVKQRLQSAGAAMPVRRLNYEDVVSEGSKGLHRFQLLVLAGAAILVIFAVTLAPVVDEFFSTQIQSSTLPSSENDFDEGEVRSLVESFALGMRDNEARETWELLSPRAQGAIGGIDEWRRQMKASEYLFSWIARRPYELSLTPLSNQAAVAVVAETGPSSRLLTPIPMRKTPNGLLVDFDGDREIELTPVHPEITAGCAGGSCETGLPLPPEISAGDALSFLLEPADEVAEAYVSVGGDEYVETARLTESSGDLTAAVDYQGGATPGDSVLLVSILRKDGGVDSYAYRVMVHD